MRLAATRRLSCTPTPAQLQAQHRLNLSALLHDRLLSADYTSLAAVCAALLASANVSGSAAPRHAGGTTGSVQWLPAIGGTNRRLAVVECTGGKRNAGAVLRCAMLCWPGAAALRRAAAGPDMARPVVSGCALVTAYARVPRPDTAPQDSPDQQQQQARWAVSRPGSGGDGGGGGDGSGGGGSSAAHDYCRVLDAVSEVVHAAHLPPRQAGRTVRCSSGDVAGGRDGAVAAVQDPTQGPCCSVLFFLCRPHQAT